MSELAVGLLLPTREAFVRGDLDPRPLLGLADAAAELGFDSVWASDSPLARPRWEPLTLLSALAARSELTIGTAVLLAALRHPVMLAHTLATLDRLARGRLILGVGAGFPLRQTEAEFEALGVPHRERFGRLAEVVAICRALWAADGPTDFDGRYFKFEALTLEAKPAQPGGPPVWLAGAGPSALRRAGRAFDGWLPYAPSADEYRDGLAAIARHATEAGREPGAIQPAQYVTVHVADDADRARAELDAYCRGYYGFPLEAVARVQAFYAGDAAGCARWLTAFAAAGARHLVVRLGALDSHRTMLERFAAGVLPALRDL